MKKWIAVLLCIALLTVSTGLLLPSAGAAEFCDCNCVPVIRLTGGQGALTENFGTPEEKSYYGMDMLENLQRDLVPALDGLKESLLTFNPSKIVDALIATFFAWVGPLALNPDGTGVYAELDRYDFEKEYTMSRGHKEPGLFYSFPFDWRRSPLEIADKLNDFVQDIKVHTGHEHVNIEGLSGSCAVLIAYTDKYVNGAEHPDAQSIVIGYSAASGTQLFGEFLNASIHFNPKNLGMLDIIYITEDIDEEVSGTIVGVANALYYLGIMDVLVAALSFFPEAAGERIYEELIRKTYASFPGIWSWVSPEDYDAAKARLIDGHPEYQDAGFLDKIDSYRAMQDRIPDILKEANEKIKVAVMVGYNMALVPAGRGENSYLNSDVMVTVEKASLGAIAAPYGKTLGKNYKQVINDGHNHVSPDNVIDASTGALPENTWYIKNSPHRVMYDYGGWYWWWKDAPKGEDTVFSNPDYPQYMQMLKKNQNDKDPLIPVTAEPETFTSLFLGFWDELLFLFRALLERTLAPLRTALNESFWSIWF